MVYLPMILLSIRRLTEKGPVDISQVGPNLIYTHARTAGASSEAGIAYHSKAPEFTPVFSEVRIDCSIFSFLWCFAGHCLSLFLLAIVLSILLRLLLLFSL